MGFLPNNGILSYKYLNAKIKDAGGRIRFVQVKNYLGDYFVTTINQQPYVFKVDAGDVGIYDEWGVKKYRIVDFSTKHYRPISDKTDKIKHLLEDNDLPKINVALFDVLKNLGKREKKDFEKHEVQILLDELVEAKASKIGKILGRESKYQEAAANVIDFLNSLGTKEIVTPTREIAEYIEDDLITTDPGYGGTVITTHQRTDIEHKRITNTPVGPKRPYAILLAIIFGVMLAILGIYLLIENGTFENIPGLDSFNAVGDFMKNQNSPSAPPAAVSDKYPSPGDAKCAIENGSAKIADFPVEMRELVSKAECKVVANP